ncbi:beta-lactamase family protein [Streptomyces coriariae]|uniref:beta-lactamase family protein n=1 Tax=Streptomyces coriariae TaxID=2864460 RepID=UPI001E52F730|nr:beta-lactamase family protein [Streptomyces coriariae]
MVVLAHVVERVTGKPFRTFIQREFFAPPYLRVTVPPAVDVLRPRGSEEGRFGAGVLLAVCNADPPDDFRAADRLPGIRTK